jgi:hypothetical protein
LDRVSRDPSFIQLAPCAAPAAPRFIAKNVPPDEDVGLLVLNMGTTVGMDDAAYAAYRSGLSETLRPWGGRALWVEVESVRGEIFSTTLQFRVHRFQEGVLRQHIATSLDLSAPQVKFSLEETSRFLAV